jgi:hypothetical protein
MNFCESSVPQSYSYDLSTFGGRLNTAMDQMGYHKVLPLAQKLGIPESGIRAYLVGRALAARGPRLALLAEILGISAQWLATGEGPIHPGEGKTTPKRVSPYAHPLNQELLKGALQVVDETLAKGQKQLSPDKKAAVVSEVYSLLLKENASVLDSSVLEKVIPYINIAAT